METRNSVRRLNETDNEDIMNVLRQTELHLLEKERAIQERENALLANAAKSEMLTTRHQPDNACQAPEISVREAIDMISRYDG